MPIYRGVYAGGCWSKIELKEVVGLVMKADDEGGWDKVEA
jgi:hypothetical protein